MRKTNDGVEFRQKPYYSVRTGKNLEAIKVDLLKLLSLFKPLFDHFEKDGFLQDAIGYDCVDAGFVPGYLGQNLEGAILLELQKTELTPVSERIGSYTEDDLFDVVEFFHEHCAKPLSGTHHTYYNCGWHYSKFDKEAGQIEFRIRANKLLRIYSTGYELTEEGEVVHLVDSGLEELVNAEIPRCDPENVELRIEAAKRKFRQRQSTDDDRRDAVRELADVLEFLRPKIKKVLIRKDENDLFNIANNFAIRHHNESQQTDYDKSVWHPWMFYFYLSTIHAVLRMIAPSEVLGKSENALDSPDFW